MMNTYLAKHLQAQIAVEWKSKEASMKNINKEDIPRQQKEHGPRNVMANIQQHRNKCSKKNI